MFELYGFFGLFVGIAILVDSLLLGSASSIPGLGGLGLVSLGEYVFGAVMIIMGALGMVAGVWIFRSNTKGIWVGAPLLGIGIVFAFIIILIGGRSVVGWEIGITFIGIDVIMTALAGWGYDSMESAENGENEDSLQ